MNLTKDQLDLLFLILKTNSPSGHEQQMISTVGQYMSHFCNVSTDSIGNLYMKVGADDGLKVMITAHSDEVGMQVTYVDKLGYVYARDVATVDKQTLPGSIVVALTQGGEIYGVIGKKSPHIQDSKEKDKILNVQDLWIDFGFDSQNEALEHIKCGDYITLASTPQITSNGNKIISKALDDKIGVFVLVEVVKRLSKLSLPISVVGVVTVQEELGCRGSIVASNIIRPDVAFCIDVGIATDIPSVSSTQYGELKLGKGVGLIKNANNNEILVDRIKSTAERNNIPTQTIAGYRPTGGTEAAMIQLSNQGVATANICIPNRYMHSLVEMCDMRDVIYSIDLLSAQVDELQSIEKSQFNMFNPSIN